MLADIEAMVEAVTGLETSDDLDEHGRVMRVLAQEPELHALAAAQDQELVIELRARLTAQLDGRIDPLTLLLLAELAVAVWRASWARWGELAADEKTYDPVEVYRETREALRLVSG